jgi:hypothetical protein
MKIEGHGYVVNHRDKFDDKEALEFYLLFPLCSSKMEAWRRFLTIAQKDRQYWNKLGYIAQKVKFTIELET